jgi:ribosomal protein S18 acetylase RimI-like enzyme
MDGADFELLELKDERDPVTTAALELIAEIFPRSERQPLHELALEVQEKRLGLLVDYDFHLLAGVDPQGNVGGVVAGVYLGGVNAGFVTYLAVRGELRSAGLGRQLRTLLVEQFRSDARRTGWDDLAWVVGEVRIDSPWLERLVRERGAIPFDLVYYHPGTGPNRNDPTWVLYRQPVSDMRREISADEARRLLYSIWRRAYRVRYPLDRDGFCAMLEEIGDRETVGVHPLGSEAVGAGE